MILEDNFYRRLIATAPFGYANFKKAAEVEGSPADYECVEVNPIFEALTGLTAAEFLRRKISQGIPGLTNATHDWITLFDSIAEQGVDATLESYSGPLKHWYKVYAYSSEKSHIVMLFLDITQDKIQSAERIRAEESLATERNLFLTMINTMPDRVYVTDKECRFILNNAAHLTSLGVHSQSEVAGKTDQDFRQWELSTYSPTDDRHVIQSGEAIYNREESAISTIGENSTMLTSKVPFLDSQGNVTGLVSVSRDISMRKRMEDGLKRSEARFKTVSRLSSDFSYSCTHIGLNGFLDDWITEAFHVLTGYDKNELREKQCWLFTVHPEDRSRIIRQFNALRAGESLEHEFRLLTKNGAVVWINNKIECVADNTASGKGRIFGAVKNITERKLREEALRESEERHRITLLTAMDGYWLTDIHGKLLEVNEAYAEMSGYSIQELLAMRIPDLESAEVTADTAEHMKRIIAQGEDRSESRHRRKDGSIFDIEVSVQHQQAHGGRFVAFMRDITERKRAEASIRHVVRLYALLSQINQAIVRTREQEELFRTICQVAIDYGHFSMAWVGMYDETSDRIMAVAHAGDEDGYLDGIHTTIGNVSTGAGPTGSAFREGTIQATFDIATEPRMLPWRDEALKRGYRSSAAVPFRQKGKIIGIFTLYAGESGFFTPEEQQMLREIGDTISFALDAIASEAERRNTEKAFRENEERLRTLIAESPVGIAQSQDGITLDANPAYLKMFGYSDVSELSNTPLIDQIAPQCREEILSRIRSRAEGKTVETSYETIGLRKDGTHFPFLVSVARIVLSGRPVSFSFFSDLSERRNHELILDDMQRRENGGALTGRTVRDVSDLLGTMMGNVSLARTLIPAGHPAVQPLEKALTAAEQAAELAEHMLASSAKGSAG